MPVTSADVVRRIGAADAAVRDAIVYGDISALGSALPAQVDQDAGVIAQGFTDHGGLAPFIVSGELLGGHHAAAVVPVIVGLAGGRRAHVTDAHGVHDAPIQAGFLVGSLGGGTGSLWLRLQRH
jgi:hypothetical protein